LKSYKAQLATAKCYLPRELEEESSAILVLRLSVLSIVVAFLFLKGSYPNILDKHLVSPKG